MNSETAVSWLLSVIFVVGFVTLVNHLTIARGDTILNRWAARYGVQIMKRNYAWFLKGPFFWTTSRGQAVFRVEVQDRAGNLRNGWVRCGGWWSGLLSDDAEVRWDD